MVSASTSLCVRLCVGAHLCLCLTPTFSSRPQSVRHSRVLLTWCKSSPGWSVVYVLSWRLKPDVCMPPALVVNVHQSARSRLVVLLPKLLLHFLRNNNGHREITKNKVTKYLDTHILFKISNHCSDYKILENSKLPPIIYQNPRWCIQFASQTQKYSVYNLKSKKSSQSSHSINADHLWKCMFDSFSRPISH